MSTIIWSNSSVFQAVLYLSHNNILTETKNINRNNKKGEEHRILLILSYPYYNKMRIILTVIFLCIQAEGIFGQAGKDGI